ncbi:MAG: DNA-processing protein DprA [Candidatus Pacebacteria bacterium]|nr:DNA-processing protein DprA [Candidatus Paceibacterota bacterium]
MNHPIKTLASQEFPPLLTEIPDKPKQLFLRGVLPNHQKILSVVGARKYSPYGKDVCERLIEGLRGYSIAIVSGLALGIDSIAHRAALKAGLYTLAIPGSGLSDNVLYPSLHRNLAKEILSSGGGLLSEFEEETRAAPWTFPRRNRIMAGISHATLVIEAEKKSGTLITSRLATEYNRDVFTVPGSIFSKNSEGPHMLLRLGATPITSAEELLDALGFEKDEKAEKNIDCSPQEKKILEILHTPLSRDELIRQSKMTVSEANTLLSIMEIKGLVEETLGEIRRS